ncbi:MAG TPA: acyltransferase [Hyphomicrobiales bacterium]|nr:acyltransferase [Hyphomicrobiales bacterium]
MTAAQRGEWPFLDFLRATSALLVLFGHTRNWFFLSIASVDHPGLLLKAFWFLTVVEQESVIVFFVLSGFLVGGSIVRACAADRFNLAAYLTARFARIYVVFLPALALTFVIFAVGGALLRDPGGDAIRPLFSERQLDFGGLHLLLCHLAGVQGFACPAWSQNPPLWSLGYEWTLYLTAPLLIGLSMMQRPLAWRVAGVVLVVAMLLALSTDLVDCLFWVSTWFLGVVAAVLAKREVPVPTALGAIGLGAAVAAVAVARLQFAPVLLTHEIIALGVALAMSCRGIIGLSILPRFFRWLAGFSFSLYATHLPVVFLSIALLQSWGFPTNKVAPGPVPFVEFGVTVLAAMVVAYLFSLVTERQTDRLRMLLSQARGPARPALAAG